LNVLRRAACGCAANGGHGRVEWGRRFALFMRFTVLAGHGHREGRKGREDVGDVPFSF